MLTAVVTRTGSSVEVTFPVEGAIRAEEKEVPEDDVNPIAPEPKEVIWGFGAFVVFAVALRFWLFPKVRSGMQRRYDKVQADEESAETITAAARADVAEYEARLASVRAEAQQKLDAARAALESERAERIAEVNARISDRRSVAATEVERARAEALGDVESAVTDVATRAAEIAIGRPVDAGAARSSVRSAMGAEATS